MGFYFTIKALAAYPQLCRSLCLIPMGLLKGTQKPFLVTRSRLPAMDFRGKVHQVDPIQGADNKGMFDCMAKFSDITWPGILHERLVHLVGEAFDLLAKLLIEQRNKMRGQQGDILTPIS